MKPPEDVAAAAVEGSDGEERGLVDRDVLADLGSDRQIVTNLLTHPLFPC